MTSTTRSPGRAAAGRSRLFRTAAAVVGALSIAGLALAGSGSAASAATPESTPTSAVAAPATNDPRLAGQRRDFCLYIRSRHGSDNECGRDVAVYLGRGFTSMGAWAGRRSEVCVSVNWSRDCERGGWASVRGHRDANRVGLKVEDAEVCLRARVGHFWMREQCGDEGDWVYAHGGWRPITGLRVKVDYDRHHGDDDHDDDDDDDDDHDNGHHFKGRH